MSTALGNRSDFDGVRLPDGKPFRIHLVVSQWNSTITKALETGAKKTLLEAGVLSKNIQTWEVPGSFELVYGSKRAQELNPDAVIAIGSVIQGETKHFDFVCQAVSQGIKDLNVMYEVPVVFCVLTDDNLKQAQDRSGGKYGNKGVEAAVTALHMAALKSK